MWIWGLFKAALFIDLTRWILSPNHWRVTNWVLDNVDRVRGMGVKDDSDH